MPAARAIFDGVRSTHIQLPPTARQRSYGNWRKNVSKCQDCRTSRKKCEPDERLWPTKCFRCVEKGLQCSVPTLAGETLLVEEHPHGKQQLLTSSGVDEDTIGTGDLEWPASSCIVPYQGTIHTERGGGYIINTKPTTITSSIPTATSEHGIKRCATEVLETPKKHQRKQQDSVLEASLPIFEAGLDIVSAVLQDLGDDPRFDPVPPTAPQVHLAVTLPLTFNLYQPPQYTEESQRSLKLAADLLSVLGFPCYACTLYLLHYQVQQVHNQSSQGCSNTLVAAAQTVTNGWHHELVRELLIERITQIRRLSNESNQTTQREEIELLSQLDTGCARLFATWRGDSKLTSATIHEWEVLIKTLAYRFPGEGISISSFRISDLNPAGVSELKLRTPSENLLARNSISHCVHRLEDAARSHYCKQKNVHQTWMKSFVIDHHQEFREVLTSCAGTLKLYVEEANGYSWYEGFPSQRGIYLSLYFILWRSLSPRLNEHTNKHLLLSFPTLNPARLVDHLVRLGTEPFGHSLVSWSKLTTIGGWTLWFDRARARFEKLAQLSDEALSSWYTDQVAATPSSDLYLLDTADALRFIQEETGVLAKELKITNNKKTKLGNVRQRQHAEFDTFGDPVTPAPVPPPSFQDYLAQRETTRNSTLAPSLTSSNSSFRRFKISSIKLSRSLRPSQDLQPPSTATRRSECSDSSMISSLSRQFSTISVSSDLSEHGSAVSHEMVDSLHIEDFPTSESDCMQLTEQLDDWLKVQHVVYFAAQEADRTERQDDYLANDTLLAFPNLTGLGPEDLGVRTWLQNLPDHESEIEAGMAHTVQTFP